MIDDLKRSSEKIVKSLTDLKSRLMVNTHHDKEATDDIIKTIATSDTIPNDIKELLLVLHTTTMTEFSTTRVNNYVVNKDIIELIDLAITTQTKIIYVLDKKCTKTTDKKSRYKSAVVELLTCYKAYIGIILVVGVVWGLMYADNVTTSRVLTSISSIRAGK